MLPSAQLAPLATLARLGRQCQMQLETYARSDFTVLQRQVALNLALMALTVSKLVGFQYLMDAEIAIQASIVPFWGDLIILIK